MNGLDQGELLDLNDWMVRLGYTGSLLLAISWRFSFFGRAFSWCGQWNLTKVLLVLLWLRDCCVWIHFSFISIFYIKINYLLVSFPIIFISFPITLFIIFTATKWKPKGKAVADTRKETKLQAGWDRRKGKCPWKRFTILHNLKI